MIVPRWDEIDVPTLWLNAAQSRFDRVEPPLGCLCGGPVWFLFWCCSSVIQTASRVVSAVSLWT